MNNEEFAVQVIKMWTDGMDGASSEDHVKMWAERIDDAADEAANIDAGDLRKSSSYSMT